MIVEILHVSDSYNKTVLTFVLTSFNDTVLDSPKYSVKYQIEYLIQFTIYCDLWPVYLVNV